MKKAASRKTVWIGTTWLLLFSIFAPMLHAGKLDRARSATRKSKPAKRSAPDHHDDEDDDDDRNHRRGDRHHRGGHRGNLHRGNSNWLGISFSSFDRCPPPPPPVVIINETYDVCHDANACPGNDAVIVSEVIPPPQFAPAPISQQLAAWSHRIALHGGTDFDGLDQTQFAWLIQQPGGLGLDVSAKMFREEDSDFHDSLWIGDANLVFEPVTGPLRTRLGIGMNWLGDHEGFEAGVNLTAGFDWELSENFITSGEIDLGSLGTADFSHAQITVGYQVDAVEWFTGYSRYNIGGAKLDGLIYGIRLRF